MKKIILNIVMAFLMFSSFEVSAQGVNIADTNFLNALILIGVDQNNNKQIEVSEAELVGVMDVSGKNISSMSGISAFTNLTKLVCHTNHLTALDLSQNHLLTEVNCASNEILTLDVNNAPGLQLLSCYSNKLETLNLASNTALKRVDCFINALTTLDLSANHLLEEVNCYTNKLTSLNVNGAILMHTLTCQDNLLTSLDVSENVSLFTLGCSKNQLASINIDPLTALAYFDISTNPLASLNLANNTELVNVSCHTTVLSKLDMRNNLKAKYLTCNKNPNLVMICIMPDQLVDFWIKDEQAQYSTSCESSAVINELNPATPLIVAAKYNIYGQKVDNSFRGLVIYQYTNGATKKVFQFE